jgi:hypothetical protein
MASPEPKVSIPMGTDTENLRYIGRYVSDDLERRQAGSVFDELRRRHEDDIVMSAKLVEETSFQVPFFMGPEEFKFFWVFELKSDLEFDEFRTELPSDELCPYWVIENRLKGCLDAGESPFFRDCRTVFEVEGNDLFVIEPLPRRGWKLYLASEVPDLVFARGDQFYSITSLP